MDTRADPANGSSQCSSCDAPTSSCWCLDCEEALCEDCVSAHRRVSVTRSHRLLNQPPAGGSSNPPTKFCRLHPSEPLKLFCFTCSQFTCRDCQLTTHMNHRYEFVSEALDGLKKQLQDRVEPVRAQRDSVTRALQDMRCRLRDIVQHESCLKLQLHQSYDAFLQHLKKRKEDLIQDIQKVHESELDWIHRRMTKLRELQTSLQSVTDAADKAKNTTDLMSLQTCRVQIESQLKDLPDHDLSAPQMIPQMKVVTDSNSLLTVLNFGRLDVSWVPFSVSDTSSQDPGPPGSSCSILPPMTSLQTGTTHSSSAPVHSTTASSAGHQCPPAYSSSSSSSSFCPTACPPSSASRPQSQSAVAVNCSSGSPANLSASGRLWLLPPSSFVTGFSSAAPRTFTSTCPEPQTAGLNAELHRGKHPSLDNALPPPRSCQSVTAPGSAHKARGQTGTTSVSSSPVTPSSALIQPLQPAGPLSTSPLVLQPDHAPKSVPVGLCQSRSPGQNQPAVVPVCRPSIVPPLPEPPRPGLRVAGSPLAGPSATADGAGPSPTAQANPAVTDESPASSRQPVPSDLTLERQDPSHVVKAVADSACDHSSQQVEARQQEPAENEPTSTVCEEAEPDASVRGAAGTGAEEAAVEAAAQRDRALSRRQPKVSLFRLPLPPTRPGRPLPAYRLVPGDANGGTYLEEMSDGCEAEESEPSPEPPLPLQAGPCSACGSANGSVVCLSCGRGYHRACHLPPVGPAFRSEWVCSLCQDLSDSDPYSSERPRTTRSLRLSPLNQRRCESLLLYLKVEGRRRLPQRPLKLMSERLSLGRAPYATAADFLSDSWSLFKRASSSQLLEDDLLNSLQRSFHTRAVKMFGAELPPSLLAPPNSASHQLRPNKDARAESRLKETRKRLGQFLVLMGTSAAKRAKKDSAQQ